MEQEGARVYIPSLDRHVAVRELTATGKMHLIAKRERELERTEESGSVRALIDMETISDGLFLDDISELSDLSVDEVWAMPEADIDIVIAEAKRKNPRFFDQTLRMIGSLMRNRLVDRDVT
jgi:hypothetical protein